jgi:hypothetical protein
MGKGFEQIFLHRRYARGHMIYSKRLTSNTPWGNANQSQNGIQFTRMAIIQMIMRVVIVNKNRE